jgi:hypothetical protein
VYLYSFWAALGLGRDVRRSAFVALAERSKPLVSAIHAYTEKHGQPPESLEALVPDFLPSVPGTGMCAYPTYDYVFPATDYQDNPWIIRVSTPSGFINFDQFMYFPLTNYPTQGYGGWLERIGDWAYVHE